MLPKNTKQKQMTPLDDIIKALNDIPSIWGGWGKVFI